MDRKFYIDESGNTGDLVLSENNNNFGNQLYFTLACIGLNDSELEKLNIYIIKLKEKYKIQTQGLKFSSMKGLFGKKIGFLLELLKYIEENSTFIIEVVDKKYIICTNIVHCLVNSAYSQSDIEPHNFKLTHQTFSQWVYDNVPLSFLIKFTNIARNPSENGLLELFDDLLALAKSSKEPLSNRVYKAIMNSQAEFIKFKKMDNLDREAFTYFLPLPDTNKKKQLIAILPYVSSFCNIHARLNSLYNRNLSDVVIIHDNQSHFDEILQHYHDTAVKDLNYNSMVFEHADFSFLNLSTLKFSDDKETIGLQIADLFAGFINKAIQYLVNNENTLDNREESIIYRILGGLYYIQSINFVLPKEHYDKLFSSLDKKNTELILFSLNGRSIDEYDNSLLKINNQKKL